MHSVRELEGILNEVGFRSLPDLNDIMCGKSTRLSVPSLDTHLTRGRQTPRIINGEDALAVLGALTQFLSRTNMS